MTQQQETRPAVSDFRRTPEIVAEIVSATEEAGTLFLAVRPIDVKRPNFRETLACARRIPSDDALVGLVARGHERRVLESGAASASDLVGKAILVFQRGDDCAASLEAPGSVFGTLFDLLPNR